MLCNFYTMWEWYIDGSEKVMTNILRYDKMGKLINGDTVALLRLTIDGKHYSANHQIPHSSRNPHKVYMVAGKSGLQSKMSEYS